MSTELAESPVSSSDLIEAPGKSLAVIKCPEPGFYPSTPEEQYRAWDACNNSTLTKMEQFSPMHAQYERAHPAPLTEAKKQGLVIHTAILEPNEFEARFCVAGQCCAVTGKGARCENQGIIGSGDTWYCGVHKKNAGPIEADGRVIIPRAHYDAARIIGDRVRSHPFANAMIFGEGANELAGVVDRDVNLGPDGEYSLRCKFKVDMLRPFFDAMGDLKTTECAAKDEFGASIYKWGYHRQAAFYMDACALLGKPVAHFAFIVFEKRPPYGVAVYELSKEDIDLGREELAVLMRQYAACERLNNWYGYGAEFEPISIKPWDMKRAMDKLAEKTAFRA